MNYLEWIIKLGAVITALGIIFGFIWGAIKLAIKPIIKKFETLESQSTQNYMGILRLTIMSREMPIGERIVAGHKYLKEGGNGEVKSFLKKEFNITDTVDEASHYKK